MPSLKISLKWHFLYFEETFEQNKNVLNLISNNVSKDGNR